MRYLFIRVVVKARIRIFLQLSNVCSFTQILPSGGGRERGDVTGAVF